MTTHYNFTHNGTEIIVQISKDDGHKITYSLNGNTAEIEFKGFTINYQARTIDVFWVERLLDSAGIVLRSQPREYSNGDIDRYNGLYHAQNFAEAAGDFYAKQCLNGISIRVFGIEIFSMTGDFVAPE